MKTKKARLYRQIVSDLPVESCSTCTVCAFEETYNFKSRATDALFEIVE